MTDATKFILDQYIREAEVKGSYFIDEIKDPFNTAPEHPSPTEYVLVYQGLCIEIDKQHVKNTMQEWIDNEILFGFNESSVMQNELNELENVKTADVEIRSEEYAWTFEEEVELRWV